MNILTANQTSYRPLSSRPALRQEFETQFQGPTDSVTLSSSDEGSDGLHTLKVLSLGLMGFAAGGTIGCFIPSGGMGPVMCFGMMGAMLATHLA